MIPQQDSWNAYPRRQPRMKGWVPHSRISCLPTSNYVRSGRRRTWHQNISIVIIWELDNIFNSVWYQKQNSAESNAWSDPICVPLFSKVVIVMVVHQSSLVHSNGLLIKNISRTEVLISQCWLIKITTEHLKTNLPFHLQSIAINMKIAIFFIIGASVSGEWPPINRRNRRKWERTIWLQRFVMIFLCICNLFHTCRSNVGYRLRGLETKVSETIYVKPACTILSSF